jgi:hypothetical protein
MEELFKELNIIENKYIIVYYNENYDNNLFVNKILGYNEFLEYKIILFYKNKKESNFDNKKIIELIYDENIEKHFLEKTFSIFYITDDTPSNILINFLKKNNEILFFYKSFDFKDTNLYIPIKNNYISSDSDEDNNDESKSDTSSEIFEINEDDCIEDSMNIYNNNDRNIFINKYIDEEFNKKEVGQQNIKIQCIKNEINDNTLTINSKINLITFFKYFEDDEITNALQHKCIIENFNNKDVESIIIIGKNLEKYFNELYVEKNKKKEKVTLINNEDENISYSLLFDVANKYYNNKNVCIIKSDIIIPNQDNIENIDFLFLEKNTIISLSRFERLINGSIIKLQELNSIFYSTEQDAYIFKTPIELELNEMNNIYFYNKFSNLEVNNILVKNNYKLINDTKNYKIIRICIDNNINYRKIINNINIKDIDKNNLYLLPENMLFDNFNLNNLSTILKMNDDDINDIKIYMLNKYVKNKILI